MAPASRHLRTQLEGALGPEATDELLNLMPPDWTQLATKTDLAVLGTELRSEMAELRGELRTEMAELRGEVHSEIAELRGEMHLEFRRQTTFVVASMFAFAGIMTGLTTLMATLN